jgi:hypothetical protein
MTILARGKSQLLWLLISLSVITLIAACQNQRDSESKTSPSEITASQFADLTPATLVSTPMINDQTMTPVTDSKPTKIPTNQETTSQSIPQPFAYTYQRPDGNRLVEGKGSLPASSFIDIPLEGIPQWLVGTAFGKDSLWVVVLDNGQVQAFSISDGQVIPASVLPEMLINMPPILQATDEKAELIELPSNTKGYTHPVVYNSNEERAFIDSEKGLVFQNRDGLELNSLDIHPLPDGRILTDSNGRLLLLSNPTERYGHGVLGDATEAAGITLVETDPERRKILDITIPEPDVIEGIAPIWVDLTGDGEREIIVTQSNENEGAQIVIYTENGERIAASEPIGLGFRWRHQIAVAPFGPNGEVELVDVRTPHIGGVVEFFQLIEDELVIMGQVPGFTSHVIGTRNLDMAVAGDFDGDGRPVLLLPNQERSELGAIRRTDNGAEVAWIVPVDGRVSSNLSAVSLENGNLAVGVGREDGVLRIWHP